MIFLKDNALVEREITSDDIKPRLLGHWGTCPGLSLVYAHINRLICKNNIDALYVVGPGHGAPGILSCLWLENSLGNFYPKYSRDREGLSQLVRAFSAPGGFPRSAHQLLHNEYALIPAHIVTSTPKLRAPSTKVVSSVMRSVCPLAPSWTNPTWSVYAWSVMARPRLALLRR